MSELKNRIEKKRRKHKAFKRMCITLQDRREVR